MADAKPARNLVWMPPQGIVLALQYFSGDEERAFRLARLLADIEPRRREDVTIAFFRRFDMPTESARLWETRMHVGYKFGTVAMVARREGAGHPHGCNELWSSCMEQFSEAWRAGRLHAHSIFTLEADGVPLRADWLDRLLAAHRRTLAEGKRITGPVMQGVIPHINGSLIAHLSLWFDRLSLHQTPATQGWDLFHAQVLQAEARPDPWIKNIYGACNWSTESLFAMSHETAWLASQKDDSAIEWAERNLVATSPIRRARRAGCFCPDPYNCAIDACRCDCGDCRGQVGEKGATMATKEELLERVAKARRIRAEAGRELDEANQALVEFENAQREVGADDGAGDEVVHPPGLRRVSVRG